MYNLRIGPGGRRADEGGASQQRDRPVLLDRFGRLERPLPRFGRERGGGGGHPLRSAAGQSGQGVQGLLSRFERGEQSA